MKVLILGHKGMLGHMVSKLLISKDIEVVTTKCRWPASCFKRTLMEFDGDYIINCDKGHSYITRNDVLQKRLNLSWFELYSLSA